MNTVRYLAIAGALMVGTVACGGGDEGECNGSSFGGGLLEGSYCSNTELKWTEVRTKLQVSGNRRFFSVEYVRPAGDSLEKTLVLLFDISRVVPNQNQAIEFLAASGSVRRITNVIQDLTQELDRERSTLTFSAPYSGELGSRVEGEFSLFFSSTGRTLRGEFSSSLVDAAEGIEGN